MKTKIFALVAAFFMLMGGSAWAQADVKGDVNGDGVVNEQDIAAILLIMQQAGGVEQDVSYYWYVGQSIPASIGEVNNATTDKWTELGTDLSKVTQIYIETENSFGIWYLLIPKALTGFVPGDGASSEEVGWDKTDSTISGYTLWTRKSKALKLATTVKKY